MAEIIQLSFRSGSEADGTLPDGSVLVAEVFAAKRDANGDVIESSLGHRLSGELKAIVIMERQARLGRSVSR